MNKRRFYGCAAAACLAFTGAMAAQELTLNLTNVKDGQATFAVGFTAAPGIHVTALQFDLVIDRVVLEGTTLKFSKGGGLGPDVQLEARSLPEGRIRAVLIPPIRANLPSVPSGEIAVFTFSVKGGSTVDAGSIDFVRRSVVFSDAEGRSVSVRGLHNRISGGRVPR